MLLVGLFAGRLTVLRVLLLASIAAACVAAGPVAPTRPSTGAPFAIGAPTPELAQLLGIVEQRLVRVDPGTLQPRPGSRLLVGTGGCASREGGTACWSSPSWTASPDGARLAVARNDASALQLVNVATMRVVRRLQWEGGPIGALAWLAPGRVIAIQESLGERQRVVVFDLAKKRISSRRALNGAVVRVQRTESGLVLLLEPGRSIGRARVAVVDRGGAVRFARLDRIVAGSKLVSTGAQHRVDARSPGLAVDPESGRAFVVAQELVAEVDLRTVSVSYHSPKPHRSLLSRLWNWLEPAAFAKQVSGYQRQAEWLGADLVAVSGTDVTDGRYKPAGLILLDTRSWSVRTVDREATLFDVADDALLVMGWSWDTATGRERAIGLIAYAFDGTKRFHHFEGEPSWIGQVYDGRAYVNGSGQEPLRIVDLKSGSIVGMREQPLPWLLLGPGSGWWG